MTTTAGRRERKKLSTHESLRAAALRLVAERGLEHVRVEDIAEAADVTSRTFFNHFSSKEDAVVGTEPGRLDALRATLEAAPAGETPLAVLWIAMAMVVAGIEERQEEQLLQLQVVRDNPGLIPTRLAAFGEFERALVECVAARTGTDPDRDLYPTVAAGAALAALRASLRVWRADGGSVDLASLMRNAFETLGGGLEPPRGRKMVRVERKGHR